MVDDEDTPQVQGKTNPPSRYTTPPVQSDTSTTSPRRNLLLPCAVSQDNSEDEAARLKKPQSKLTIKALQKARAEVHPSSPIKVGEHN